MPEAVDLTTTIVNVFKTLYQTKSVETLFYQKYPFLSMLPKQPGFYGEDLKISVMHSVPQGLGHTFADAQTNRSAGETERFSITRKSGYAVWELDNETMRASSNDAGALVRVLKTKTDQALMGLGRQASLDIFGNSGGALGQIGSSSGSTITLASAADVVNFEIDMVIVASADDGSASGHTLLNSGATNTITKVERDFDSGAVLTFSGSIDGTWADDSYLFREGSFQLSMNGLAAWLPTDRSGLGTAFLGVTRDTDPVRLAGNYYDGSGGSIEEAIKRLATRITINGGIPDTCVMNPLDCETLEIEMENRVWRPEPVKVSPTSGKKGASFGFDTIMFRAGGHMIRLVQDRDCPRGRAYVLQMDTWKLHHLDGLPHVITEGMGNGRSRASTSADSVEMRARYWGDLGCYAPAYNGVALLPSS